MKFGTGTIISQDSATITVLFSEEYGEKKFFCPAVFKSFLSLCNPAAKDRMSNEMKMTQAFAEIELNNRLAEEEEKKRALLEQKAALKKRTPAKKSAKSL
ncbi:hypothetical protein [Oscillibacter sp.]|uniref:hypothetical protein n=1 Tax=Oscillibacter sp. TaxID=1945593 RepID=UPI0028B24946|nr:hypothetical protein [Oscillibacter sp.]